MKAKCSEIFTPNQMYIKQFLNVAHKMMGNIAPTI